MFEQTFKNIDGILFKHAGRTSGSPYPEQSLWWLFATCLHALERVKFGETEVEGQTYPFVLVAELDKGVQVRQVFRALQSHLYAVNWGQQVSAVG